MNHLVVNDSKSSILGGDGSANFSKNNAVDMTDGNTFSKSTSDKYNTNIHKTDPSKWPIFSWLNLFSAEMKSSKNILLVFSCRHKQQFSGYCKFGIWSCSGSTRENFYSAIRSCQN